MIRAHGRAAGIALATGIALAAALLGGCVAYEDTAGLPAYQRDRGTGAPTSMFGTYCRKGELLVYPFFEYYINRDQEYSPNEFGYVLDQDFTAKYKASETLLFLAYGITEDVNVEFEAALHIKATQWKAAGDPTAMPNELTESGFGDTQMEVNWRWREETDARPEVWSFCEVVFPLQKDNVLIGTGDWEVKLGTGAIKGFEWGTIMGRLAIEYDGGEKKVELGEYAIEYLKRLSPTWRVYTGLEGSEDELEFITEFQWRLGERAVVKINNAFGVTPKAVDWAPEIGVMFSF